MIPRDWSQYNQWIKPELDIDYLSDLTEILISEIHINLPTCLEVGCSNGRYLRYMGSFLPIERFYGLDIISTGFSDKQIDFIKGNGLSLPFSDNSFDFVSSFGVIEHFDKNGRKTMLEGMIRILKPGGILLTFIPNVESRSLRFAKIKLLDAFREFKHYKISLHELIEQHESAGFRESKGYYIGCGLHLGKLKLKRPKILKRNSIMSDDMIVLSSK
jgi:SAM-dependent methyltransferase